MEEMSESDIEIKMAILEEKMMEYENIPYELKEEYIDLQERLDNLINTI